MSRLNYQSFLKVPSLKAINERFRRKNYKKSYSQSGEDLIVDFVTGEGSIIPNFSYLDIGAHHPTYLSNTYLFYERGATGVCIEPDPFLFAEIKKVRHKDICLNVGIGSGDEQPDKADFYIMTNRALNTFSKEEAERYQSYGTQKIEKVIQIPLMSVNEVIKKYFTSCPNFVSLDVEGLDLKVLESFNFAEYRPEIFCVETLTYTEDKTERKLTEIIDLMTSRDYFVWADTYINSIFMDRKFWKNS